MAANEKPTHPLGPAIKQQAGLVAKQREQRTWKTYAVRNSDTANAGQRELRKAQRADAPAAPVPERPADSDVRKDRPDRELARGLIEKAADDVPGDEVAPEDVLKRAHSMLLTAFRKSTGRDPQPADDEFWTAYHDVLKELRALVAAQARS